MLSVPDLVKRVGVAHDVDEDAAVMYLQLLALAAPTNKKLQLWNGWKPARIRKAGKNLVKRELIVEAKRARAGRSFFVPGGWEALSTPAGQYKVFLHLVSEDGRLVAQYDGEPGDGLNPTTGWSSADAVFVDRYGLVVPSDASAGPYQLLAGLYDISGAPRLPVTVGGEDAGDTVLLAELTIE